MRTYGVEVNLERAVPDFRDGLKPVARRILWATHSLHAQSVKAARVVGETMGSYHPHGDQSIMGALVNMVTAPTNTMKGVGNWGTLVDPAAAMRYPNCGLSTYGKMFFGKNYTPIIDKVPTYDRAGLEPLVLPSLLPNLLFNGTSGIGVGMVTEIPAFTPTSVLKLMIRILNGEELTSLDYLKTLEFFFQYGGVATKTKANRIAIKKLFENTKGTVEWESPLDVNPTRKEITLWRFAPEVNPVKMIEGVKDKMGKKIKPGIKDWESVGKVTSGKGLSYVIKARRDLNMAEFDALVDRVRKLTTTKISYEVYVTERLSDPDAGEGKYKVNFITCSIPELFQKWLKWRCRLEARSLDWQIAQVQTAIQFLELLIYASTNLDVIFKALRTTDAAAYMVTGLKITLDQANQILDLQVRRLSKLDQTKLKEQLVSAKAKLSALKVKRKDPPGQVRLFLESCLGVFTPHTQFAGTHQFDMRIPVSKSAQESEEGA
jgi:DNA gyrase/topoisomerase IV subunit A